MIHRAEPAPSKSSINMRLCALLFSLVFCLSAMVAAEDTLRSLGRIAWTSDGETLKIDPAKLPESADNPWFAVKDPSIVRHDGRWHLFCTLRKANGSDGNRRATFAGVT